MNIKIIIHYLVFILSFVLLSPNALALDPACQPLIKSSEARMAVSAWEQTTVVSPSGFTMKLAQLDGKSYRQNAGEPWKPFPLNYIETEKQMLAQIDKGEIIISKCSTEGEKIIDGIPTQIFKYTIKMQGVEPAESTLYIGKEDYLPYAMESANVKASYKYKNVKID